MTDRQIRGATSDDVPELSSLCVELGYSVSADELANRLPHLLADADNLLLVGTDDHDRALAWIHGLIRRQLTGAPFVQIVGLVVSESARSQGIGTELVARVEAWARERGVATVRLRSNVIRARAHAFYVRNGYAVTKTSHLFSKSIAR